MHLLVVLLQHFQEPLALPPRADLLSHLGFEGLQVGGAHDVLWVAHNYIKLSAPASLPSHQSSVPGLLVSTFSSLTPSLGPAAAAHATRGYTIMYFSFWPVSCCCLNVPA